MKHFFWIIIIAVLIFCGCAKDIIVRQPAGLRGFYKGQFTMIENFGDSQGSITTDEYVLWTFSDQKYWCEVDSSREIDIDMCDHYGSYELGAEVVLNLDGTGFGKCTDSLVASGSFSFKRVIDDSDVETITLIQDVGQQPHMRRRKIVLVKEPE